MRQILSIGAGCKQGEVDNKVEQQAQRLHRVHIDRLNSADWLPPR